MYSFKDAHHLIAKGTCRPCGESLQIVYALFVEEVDKIPSRSNLAKALVAKKEFFGIYLIHFGLDSKVMLLGKTLDEVMDKFQILRFNYIRILCHHLDVEVSGDHFLYYAYKRLKD